MPDTPVRYGPHSPFDPEERATIEEIHQRVLESGRSDAAELSNAIRRQLVCLEWLGETVSEYPSPLEEQVLGDRKRGLQTLVDTLSKTNPANFEFFLPTRALLGRALVMAEANFYRALTHICRDVLDGDASHRLHEQSSRRLRVCLYTKLAEEVLSTITTDDRLSNAVRSKAVDALAQIWDRRLTYRVSEFFPILEATWEARQRITATGGTLAGTTEIFDLFKAGCDPAFVEYFGESPLPDEVEAFREFLFAASAEELNRLAVHMVASGSWATRLEGSIHASDRDPATFLFEFFRARQLQASSRRMADLPGPKHTAEAYVMIHYLDRME